MADEGKGSSDREQELTKDGTVDLEGRPFIRSKGGGWTACSFIVGKHITAHGHNSQYACTFEIPVWTLYG